MKLVRLGSSGTETFEVPEAMWQSYLDDKRVEKWQAENFVKTNVDWRSGMSQVSVDYYDKTLKTGAEQLAEEAIQYLEHRASMGKSRGRPLDPSDYRKWVQLGGEQHFSEYWSKGVES